MPAAPDPVLRRRRLANLLLAVGYALAVGAGLKFVPMWRQRRLRRFLVFEAGTAIVATALALRRRPVEASANAVTATGLAVAWLARGRGGR